jgi:fructokinase
MNRIGIDLGGTKIEGVLLDDKHNVVVRKRVPTQRSQGYQAILGRIVDLIKELQSHAHTEKVTIGICTPGAIDPSTNRLKNSNTLCLIGKPILDDLEEAVGQHVAMDNDANCFALAEAKLGAAKGENVVFGVIMGTGVGGGIVINGQIHHGHLNIAGEWGHHTLYPNGRSCYCGRKGCVETYISGPALERSWKEKTGQEQSLPEIITELTHKNTAETRTWKKEFLTNFGMALANVIDILDPDVIVLGGGVSNTPFLYNEGVRTVYHHVFSSQVDTPILKNDLGDSGGVFGAALLEKTS